MTWKVIYFFRVRKRKEILCLHVDEVLRACKEERVNYGMVEAVLANLGIEIGTP